MARDLPEYSAAQRNHQLARMPCNQRELCHAATISPETRLLQRAYNVVPVSEKVLADGIMAVEAEEVEFRAKVSAFQTVRESEWGVDRGLLYLLCISSLDQVYCANAVGLLILG